MNKKEWLKANGFPDIKVGKGRLSNDQRAAIEAAVARGVKIDGYSVSSPAADDKPAKVVRDTAPSAKVVDANVEETVPEQYNIAMVGNDVIGNRTVCDVCHRSLNYHICPSPRVMHKGESRVVQFKPRPNPEAWRPNRWW